MDGFMPVKVMVPLDVYRVLYAEASAAGTTVASLLIEKAKPTHGGHRPGAGRKSGYTTAAGEEIQAGRRFGQTWTVIAAGLGISTFTAHAWLAKYEHEVKEQNARERAERKAS